MRSLVDQEMARYLATQQRDSITYQGKVSVLETLPLEGHPDRQVADRLNAIVWRTPRLRRGYVARWAVEDGRVFLVGLDVRTGQRGRYTRRKPKLQPLPLTEIFPGQAGPIPASWIDGVLLIGRTNRLRERLGLPKFVPETILAVEAGAVESALTLAHIPTVSAIGQMLRAVVRRLLPNVFRALPSRLRGLRLRWRSTPR
jgi:hypothetical protein